MAEFADSERTLWQQAEMIRRLRGHYLEHQQILAVLARRQAGVLVIDPAELARVPSGTVIVWAVRPDGSLVLRAESPGGQGDGAEPGSEG